MLCRVANKFVERVQRVRVYLNAETQTIFAIGGAHSRCSCEYVVAQVGL